jgi:hypothetical protein
MLIKVTGILEFAPENKTRKHDSQASWKRVAMIIVPDELTSYYAWFVKKRYNLELNKPLRGTHLTIINDSEREAPMFEEARKLYDGKEVSFYIDPSTRTNGEHWWLRAYCPEGEAIREACGLRRESYFPFHMTIGYANEKVLSHSRYIHECIKRYDAEEARLKFTDHTIHEFACE